MPPLLRSWASKMVSFGWETSTFSAFPQDFMGLSSFWAHKNGCVVGMLHFSEAWHKSLCIVTLKCLTSFKIIMADQPSACILQWDKLWRYKNSILFLSVVQILWGKMRLFYELLRTGWLAVKLYQLCTWGTAVHWFKYIREVHLYTNRYGAVTSFFPDVHETVAWSKEVNSEMQIPH